MIGPVITRCAACKEPFDFSDPHRVGFARCRKCGWGEMENVAAGPMRPPKPGEVRR